MIDGLRVVRSGLAPTDQVVLDGLANPMVRPGTVPRDLAAHARRAVDVCPVLALRLHSVAGTTVAQPAVFRGSAARGT